MGHKKDNLKTIKKKEVNVKLLNDETSILEIMTNLNRNHKTFQKHKSITKYEQEKMALENFKEI